jgi:hypothetical protein
MAGSPETGRYALCVETVVLSLKHPRELGPRLFDHIQLCLICDGRLADYRHAVRLSCVGGLASLVE